jgi:hypothetical protein
MVEIYDDLHCWPAKGHSSRCADPASKTLSLLKVVKTEKPCWPFEASRVFRKFSFSAENRKLSAYPVKAVWLRHIVFNRRRYFTEIRAGVSTPYRRLI